MSTTVTIDNCPYDFSRCTREQLETYVREVMQANGGLSGHISGRVVLDAARIPVEHKADVANEVIAYLLLHAKDRYDRHTLYDFAARYEKAV